MIVTKRITNGTKIIGKPITAIDFPDKVGEMSVGKDGVEYIRIGGDIAFIYTTHISVYILMYFTM